MTIHFQCSQCQASLKVKDELAGRRVRCNACNGVITIPQAGPGPSDRLDSNRDALSADTDLPALPPISRRKRPAGKTKPASRTEARETAPRRKPSGEWVKWLGLGSLLTVAVLLVGLATWLASSWIGTPGAVSRREQLKYEGKTTSEWLVLMRDDPHETEERLLQDASNQFEGSAKQRSQLKLWENLRQLRRTKVPLFIGADPAAVPDLLDELANGNSRSGDLARRILKQFNKSVKPDLDDLIHGLSHQSIDAQVFCVRAIAFHGSQGARAIPSVVQWADAADDQVRYEASTTLAFLGSDAIEPLATMLGKETENYRNRVFSGLEQAVAEDQPGFTAAVPAVQMFFGRLELSPKQRARLLALLEKCGAPDARTVEICLAEIDAPDEVWIKASKLLSLAGPLPVKPILAKLQQDKEERSIRLIQLLGTIGPPANDAVPFLLSVARDANLELPQEQDAGRWAVVALNEIGPPAASVPARDVAAILPVLCKLTKQGECHNVGEICLWIVPKLLEEPESAKEHAGCIREMAKDMEKHIAGVRSTANQTENAVIKIFDNGKLDVRKSQAATAQNAAMVQNAIDTANRYERIVEGLHQLEATLGL